MAFSVLFCNIRVWTRLETTSLSPRGPSAQMCSIINRHLSLLDSQQAAQHRFGNHPYNNVLAQMIDLFRPIMSSLLLAARLVFLMQPFGSFCSPGAKHWRALYSQKHRVACFKAMIS